jgi:hypothetical protein
MRGYEDALNLLLAQSRELAKLGRTRKEYLDSALNAADRAEKVDKLDAQLKQVEKERIGVLRDLVRFPPHHLQYAALLEQFDQELAGKGKPYERRVFIMTKYADGIDAKLDTQLQTVIDTVKAAVAARGYHAQLAGETKLHPNLWENVECQMLACGRGVAIVEDRFNPKLNPNVAMEWGWMRAMKKPILYLVEKSVTHVPADVAGLIKGRFDWENPQADIPQLIAQDLA